MISNQYKVRFAPSPTGYLHIGNARMAVLNYLLAKQINAKYLLRIDDTDESRVKDEYIQAVYEDLKWLGISWDTLVRQSERLPIYNEILEKLKKDNIVYACYETPEELDYKKKLQISMKKPPIYDRAMLKLSEKEKREFEKEGRRPYYRLKINHNDIHWKDLIKDEIKFKGEYISDPVIVRENGSFLYILTSVIDDIEYGITHVIRGEDHIVNTAVQIQIFQYLKGVVPQFAHLPLITNEGQNFSKRDNPLSLRNLRSNGIHPMSINNYLFMMGLGEQNIIYDSQKAISKEFNLEKYNSSTAKFDHNKLLKINTYFLQSVSFPVIKKMIQDYLHISIDEHFWNIIKPNIVVFKDIKLWFDIVYEDNLKTIVEPQHKSLIKIALETLPENDIDDNFWNIWINNIKQKTNLKGKDLFQPLRLAFSGLNHGPDFKSLTLLIGKEKLTKRLRQIIK